MYKIYLKTFIFVIKTKNLEITGIKFAWQGSATKLMSKSINIQAFVLH